MPTNVSLKNVPDDVMAKLRRRAKKNHRSVQGELISIIENAVEVNGLSVDEGELRLRELKFETKGDSARLIRENCAMPAKVVDASVMAAWCFREPRAAEAFKMLKNSELHAPLLLAYELTSVARRKALDDPKNEKIVREALRTALSLPLQWHDVNHLEVWRIALERRITTYDACYLHLSNKLMAELVTFDQKLAQSTSYM